ncbi:glucosaminidase domain-containing protein [Enterobacter bugandensis]|uniref:EF-hand domain-containing protein n=6 Tax=Enterobacter TaxID=547 RepID=A0ABX4VHX8_9ENTR|nr:glucosaminidase domain-containing protein [Enterobacter bugandensis]NUX27708.1 glycoside hydrolase family 73 protein [Enterobacter bugandensis]NUX50604.1 glycoside hydrolase family 73 protein [Enterobacter bugandensis]NUX71558.1 glycoside hydrolase family 73 protein [Enterobacter bugandensis]NUX96595.1 glycoside hydrolase family 73 protein [Enterobacter bugandensis]NUY22719.1 glycoside hydrolase family 73 protein [Enterobacter bugandensis]
MKMVLPVDGYRSATEFMEALQGSEGDTHWLMKKAEHWHGGIHIYDSFAANAVFKPDSHGLKCMADGQVVAWRLNDDYQTAPFKKKMLKFSTTFVLIKSTCTPDKDKPNNALDFYTLWIQIAPLSEYGVTDTPTATVTASALKIRQDNTFSGWMRNGMSQGINVPRDALRHYEAPQDTHTTLPRGSVVEIEQEATFILNGKPAPFIFITVVSVPEGAKTGLSVGESGWISGLDKFVKRQDITLPAWMQEARKHGVFNEVVTVSVEDALPIKAGDVIGHLSLNEQPYGNSQYFCHLEVFSQDARMKDFLTNKAGVTKGVAELHTLADKMRWQHRDRDNSFVVAGVGGDPSPTTAERYTPETQCRRLEADGKTWYYIPGELAWMAAEDVERANQFDLEKRGFIPLEEEGAPQSIFQTPRESWLRQAFGRLEELARGETRDMYSSSYTEKYQKLLKQMDSNQDGVIDAGELWRFLHNRQPHIQYQVQRLVVKHHSEWLKDGTSALWQAALDEQAKKYPDLALFNRDFINKLVWMKDVPEIRSSEALWHMHPVVFLDALKMQSRRGVIRPRNVQDFLDMASDSAEQAAAKWGVPASVLLAQSALESGWGKHVKNNAYFGIKGKSPTGNSTSFGTTEVINGKVIHIKDTFRAYADYAESADDYGRFLNENKRYKPAFIHTTEPNQFITEIAKAGYATDPDYAPKLIRLMERYDLYEFDK